MYSRAGLLRTAAIVGALFLTAVATGAFARECRASDTQSADCPTVHALRPIGRLIAERSGDGLQIRVFHSRQLAHQPGEENETIEQTRVGAIDLNRTVVTDLDRKPFEAAMAGIYAKAQRDPAVAQPIERIRKVE